MKFSIYGVNFDNKGAELMLHAVNQQLKQWSANNILACHLLIGTFDQREEAGVYHLASRTFKKLSYAEKLVDPIASLIPKRVRQKKRIILESEVDIVLDAAGFAYSDQWGYNASERMAELSLKWKREGKKIIILPQAFGPFNNERVRKAFIKIVENADLIFARDLLSYKYVTELPISTDHVCIGPDFTNLLKGIVPNYIYELEGKPCIVPNKRMFDKTTLGMAERYISFLVSSIKYLREKGLDPFILIHEKYDVELGQQIQSMLNDKILIIQENDPLMLKAILGKSYFVIGSRYHSLISALSQNVPCIGTGWSHKYQMLFSDYGCEHLLLNIEDYQPGNFDILDLLINSGSRESIIKILSQNSTLQKNMATQMWEKIHEKIC